MRDNSTFINSIPITDWKTLLACKNMSWTCNSVVGSFRCSQNNGRKKKNWSFLLSFCYRREVWFCYKWYASHSLNSGSDVFNRVSTFLETLYRDMAKGGCGDNAILVSHGLFCRLFLTRFYHWSVRDLRMSYFKMFFPYRLKNFTNYGILTTASLLSWNYRKMGFIS